MGFTVLGCFLNALSLILMKYSMENHAKHSKGKDGKKKAYSVCNKWWMTGLFCIVLGTLANVVAIRYGNLLLLASSSAITMIFNTILSIYILKERFTKWDAVAFVFITTGCISCMIFSKTSDAPLSQQELINLYTTVPSLAYMSISFVYIVTCFILNRQIRNRIKGYWKHIHYKYG